MSEPEKEKKKDDKPLTIYHPQEKASKQRLESWILYILATYGLYTLTKNIISFLSGK